MTQQHVAERLAQLTGHQLPQASISAMERGFEGAPAPLQRPSGAQGRIFAVLVETSAELNLRTIARLSGVLIARRVVPAE